MPLSRKTKASDSPERLEQTGIYVWIQEKLALNYLKKLKIIITDKKTVEKALKLLALFALSFLFLLIFSLWTSPFYKNWYGCDASFFTMAGRGIVHGWVPYRDFFDLKGPYFFFIEALGQLICEGRTGAFIVQVFALFFALLLMINTCRLFISSKKTAFIVTLILTFYASTLWGGNTLEEYALPVILLAYYVVLKDLSSDFFYKNKASVHPVSALIVGICFGVIAFSKITVASPIVGLVLALIVILIRNKQYYKLLEFLIYSFLGILLSMTPVFIYFSYYGMLSRMIYAVFQFAFLRSIDFGTKFSLMWELKISGCYFAIIFAVCQLLPRKGNDGKLHFEGISQNNFSKSGNGESVKHPGSTILCKPFLLFSALFSGVITALTLHLGDPFIYYFTTVYPILMIALIGMFTIYDPFVLFRKWRLDIPVIALLIFIGYFAGHTGNQLNTVIYGRNNTYYQTYVDQAKEMASLIPSGDRNDVYSINMDMQWFECNGILPCYPYTINCQFFCALDPEIEEDIINKIQNDPPKWIVVGGDLSSYLPNVNDIVSPKYSVIYENDYGALYLLQ